jgi:L-ribulose-5-phosphate 4-epimerase
MNPISEIHRLNNEIKSSGLVELTWGNASIRVGELIYIKPSGVDTTKLSYPSDEASCIVNINTGQTIGESKPSVDLGIHLELYRGFPDINSIIHTHSKYATIFAQASRSITCLGTTHADYFNGDIPVVNLLTSWEDYEVDTGNSIVQHFKNNELDYHEINACLIEKHGAFVWDSDPQSCLNSSIVLELVAEMAYNSLMLGGTERLPNHVLEKHYKRKHGDTKYYGQ